MSETPSSVFDGAVRRRILNQQLSTFGAQNLTRALRSAHGIDPDIETWLGMDEQSADAARDDEIHAKVYDGEPEDLYAYALSAVDEAIAHNRLDAAHGLCTLLQINNPIVAQYAEQKRAESARRKREATEHTIAGTKFDLDGLTSAPERFEFLRQYFNEGFGRAGAGSNPRNAVEREMWVTYRALTVADYYHDKKATKSGAALGAAIMELRSVPAIWKLLSPELRLRITREARAKITELLDSYSSREKQEGRDLAGFCLDVGLLDLDVDAQLLDRATK